MHYKDKYDNEIKGHYIGSYEDVNMLRCQKVEELKSDVSNLYVIGHFFTHQISLNSCTQLHFIPYCAFVCF